MRKPNPKYCSTEEQRAQVLEKFYADGKPLTLEDIGILLQTSKQNVLSILTKACEKMKKELKRQYGKDVSLSDFMDVNKHHEMAKSRNYDSDDV